MLINYSLINARHREPVVTRVICVHSFILDAQFRRVRASPAIYVAHICGILK